MNLKNLLKKLEQSEAWWLLEKLTGKTKAELILEEEILLTDEQQNTLNRWVKERVEDKKPLQYILGSVPFCDLQILVEPPILIPRPETEELCAWLIDKISPVEDKFSILDIGSGSGCISLALAQALPNARVTGIDIHENAIALSNKNKAHNKITNANFIESDLYENLCNKKFDLIISNPPYISEKDFLTLSPEVSKWEDKSALVAEDDGFAIHKKILMGAPDFLHSDGQHGGRVVIECGKGQAEELKALFEKAGFKKVSVHKDLEGVDRWLMGII